MQFDEQVRMVRADSIDNAQQQFNAIGKSEECRFVTHHQDCVVWQYVGSRQLIALDEYVDGDLLYSHTIECEDQESFMHYIRQNNC